MLRGDSVPTLSSLYKSRNNRPPCRLKTSTQNPKPETSLVPHVYLMKNEGGGKLKTSLVPQVYLMKNEGGGKPETRNNSILNAFFQHFVMSRKLNIWRYFEQRRVHKSAFCNVWVGYVKCGLMYYLLVVQ